MSEQLDLDRPIVGAVNIARAAGLFTKKGALAVDKIYYKFEQGLLDGIVHKNGRELVSSLRQIQRLATTTVAIKNTK
jgi:hypothetical protein